MKKTKRHKRKKQKKVIIVSAISFLLFLTAGYAAFQINLNITAKGNIKCNPITVNDLKNKVSQENGLYVDNYRDNYYIYAGAEPNNYIYFNNEIWRIILIMDDHLKIIRDSPLNSPMNFDYSAKRFSDEKYCSSINSQGNNGCNLWGSTNDTEWKGIAGYTSKFPYRTDDYSYTALGPNDTSYINSYLNNEYYNSIDEQSKKYIEKSFFDFGLLPTMTDSSSYDISDLLTKSELLFGKYLMALPKATDYIAASTYTGCGYFKYYTSEACTKAAAAQNWMYDANHNLWTINPTENLYNGQYYTQKVAVISKDTGGIIQSNAYLDSSINYVKPTLFLNSNVKLCGNGQKNNPFRLYEDS